MPYWSLLIPHLPPLLPMHHLLTKHGSLYKRPLQINLKLELLISKTSLPASQKMSDLRDIRSIAGELATAKEPIIDVQLMVLILQGLGSEYIAIFPAIRSRPSPITYEELYEQLLDHELFLKHEEAKKTPSLLLHTQPTKPILTYKRRKNITQPLPTPSPVPSSSTTHNPTSSIPSTMARQANR